MSEIACIIGTSPNSFLSVSSIDSKLSSSLHFCANHQITTLFVDVLSNVSISGGNVNLLLGNGHLYILENNEVFKILFKLICNLYYLSKQ